MLSVKGESGVSQPSTSRPRCSAMLTCGGRKEHCWTQLTRTPVSVPSRRTVRMNSPLGTRPRAAASCLVGSLSISLLPQQFLDEFLDVVVRKLVLELLGHLAGPV